MLASLGVLLLASATFASPILEVRAVDALKQPDTDNAHPRDQTATRAFSNTEIIVCHSLELLTQLTLLDLRWKMSLC